MSKESYLVKNGVIIDYKVDIYKARRITIQNPEYNDGTVRFECKGVNGTCRCRLKFVGKNNVGFYQYSYKYHHAPGCEYDESGKGGKSTREKRIEGLDQTGDSLVIKDIFGKINTSLLSEGGGSKPTPKPKPKPKPPKELDEDFIREVYVDRPPRNPRELFDVAINKGLGEKYAGINVSEMIFCKENFDKHIVSIDEGEAKMSYCICFRTYKPKVGKAEIDMVDGVKPLWFRVYGENQKNMFIALRFAHKEERSESYNYIKNLKTRIVVYANDWEIDSINGVRFLKCTIHKWKSQIFEYDED